MSHYISESNRGDLGIIGLSGHEKERLLVLLRLPELELPLQLDPPLQLVNGVAPH